MFYFCRVTLHVPVAAVLVLNTPDDGRLRPKHVEWPCRNKTCTVLHQVGVSFDLFITLLSVPNHRNVLKSGRQVTRPCFNHITCENFVANPQAHNSVYKSSWGRIIHMTTKGLGNPLFELLFGIIVRNFHFHFPHSVIRASLAFLTFWRQNYFFLILAHPVYKMWIIQEPNKLELWNKLHLEEKKTDSIHCV